MSVSGLSGSFTSFDHRGMRSNNPRTSNRKLHAASKALMARFEVDGFPIEARFTSDAAIDDYLGGDAIVCLRCGKPYKSLGGHLRVHGWTADDYKEFYGLPWGSALACQDTIVRKRECGLRNYAQGVGFPSMSEDERAAARQARITARHRPHTPVATQKARARLVALNGGVVMDDAAYENILTIMSAQDLTLREAIKIVGKPSNTMFHQYRRNNPEFAQRFTETVDALSFATQARCSSLGKAFSEYCTRRRREGATVAVLMKETGVSHIPIIRATKGWRDS